MYIVDVCNSHGKTGATYIFSENVYKIISMYFNELKYVIY